MPVPLSLPQIDDERSAERRACITRGRLYPDATERPSVPDGAVEDAVKGDAARHAQVVRPGRTLKPPGDLQYRVLRGDLHRMGYVMMALLELFSRGAGRPEPPPQVARVDGVAAFLADADRFPESAQEPRPAKGNQRHDLILVRRMEKTEV